MSGIRNSVATATLKDVAREAEVSVATVSRVINGSENVSKTTRSRVLSAIETLKYTPNAYAIQLRGMRHRSSRYGQRVGDAGHAQESRMDDVEALRIQNKRLKRVVQTLLRDLTRWRSIAEDSIESA